MGLRGLDLSSILSGAPGRAERKVGGEEERRANLELSGGRGRPGEAADERPRLPLDTVNGRTRRRARCDWTNCKAGGFDVESSQNNVYAHQEKKH